MKEIKQSTVPKTCCNGGFSAKLRSLKAGVALDWRDLDSFLDGGALCFPSEAKKLLRKLDRLKISIKALGPQDPKEADGYDAPYHQQNSLRRDGVASYEQELHKLPRLNRVGEFRMGKRYEFLVLRAEAALNPLKLSLEQRKMAITKGRLPELPVTKSEKRLAQIQRAESRLREMAVLRDAWIRGTLYIVMRAVHRYRNLGIDTADLIQEGNISLFQALEGFDWRRSVRFKTYAEYWVNQAFLKILYNNVRTVRVPVWVQKQLKKIKDLQKTAMQQRGRPLTPQELGEKLEIPGERVEKLLETKRFAVSLDAKIGDDEGGRVGDLIEDERILPVEERVVDIPLRERLEEVLEELPERERLILNLRYGLDGKTPKTLIEIGDLLKVSAERVRQLQEAALKRMKLPKVKKRLQSFAF
jgi:RNA polymerase primary sigma factor